MLSVALAINCCCLAAAGAGLWWLLRLREWPPAFARVLAEATGRPAAPTAGEMSEPATEPALAADNHDPEQAAALVAALPLSARLGALRRMLQGAPAADVAQATGAPLDAVQALYRLHGRGGRPC